MALLNRLFSPIFPEDEQPNTQHIWPGFTDSSYFSSQTPALAQYIPSSEVYSTAGPDFNGASSGSQAQPSTPTNYAPLDVGTGWPDSNDVCSLTSQQSVAATNHLPTPIPHLLDNNHTTSIPSMNQYDPYATQGYWYFPSAPNVGGAYHNNSYSQMIPAPVPDDAMYLDTSTGATSQNLNWHPAEQFLVKTEALSDDSIARHLAQEAGNNPKIGIGAHRHNAKRQYRKQPYEVPHDRKMEGGSSNEKPDFIHRDKYFIAWRSILPSDSLDYHMKRDDGDEAKIICPGCSIYKTCILEALQCWAKLKHWSPETLEDAKWVWKDLVDILELESTVTEKDLRVTQDAFKSTLSNPRKFSDFVARVLSTRQNITCEKLSLSRSTANKHVKRLGVASKHVYELDGFRTVMELVKSLHSLVPVPGHLVKSLNSDLLDRRVSAGKSEIIASNDVERYFATLFLDTADQAGFLIHQPRLGNSDEELTLEDAGNDGKEKLYVSCNSKMDFLVVALNQKTREEKTEKTKVTNIIPYVVLARGCASQSLRENFDKWSDSQPRSVSYPDVKAYVTRVVSSIPKRFSISYETTIIEVKKSEQPFTRAENRKEESSGKSSGKHCLDSSTTINQVLSTCRILGADWTEDERLVKFMSTDARFWRFGLVNNDTGVAHYTEVFDNSNLEITDDILYYIAAWHTLPPRFINDEIFARITTKQIILS